MDFTNIKLEPVRSASILTNAYVAGTVIENAEKYNVMSLLIDFTKGSLTDCQIKVEGSMDGTNYYQLLSDSISAGVNSVAGLVYKLTANTAGSTTPLTINVKKIKISAIGTGTVTGSSLAISAIMGRI